jgi:hypothetical protein
MKAFFGKPLLLVKPLAQDPSQTIWCSRLAKHRYIFSGLVGIIVLREKMKIHMFRVYFKLGGVVFVCLIFLDQVPPYNPG